MNEQIYVSEKSSYMLVNIESRSQEPCISQGNGSIRNVCPSSISGINTFLLQTRAGAVRMRFDAIRPGFGHIIHILDTPVAFREALLAFGHTGNLVEVFQEDGSVFSYTYHKEEEHGSDR